MKYIILHQHISSGMVCELPVIFPKAMVHALMFEVIKEMYKTVHKFEGLVTCVSAGFINLDTMTCYGESESLGIKSRPEDGMLILHSEYFSVKPTDQ